LKAQAAVLVSSRFSNAVKEYDEQGNFIRDLVPSGSGGLYDGDGLAIGPDGNLYVANFLGGNVLRYNGKTGEFIDVFVPGGTGAAGTPNQLGLRRPTTVTFGPDGNLYVSNFVSRGPVPEAYLNDYDNILEFDGKPEPSLKPSCPLAIRVRP
jgi:glucose/arabinose dehydrogenase